MLAEHNEHKWFALLREPFKWGSAGALVFAVISLGLPNQFTSVASILPMEARSMGTLSSVIGAAAAMGIPVGAQDGAENNYTDILQSRWLGERLLTEQFTFHYRAWRFGRLQERQETLLAFLEADNLDRGMRALPEVLFISRDIKSKVLVVKATTNSQDLSQALTQRAIELLEVFLREKVKTRGGGKAAFAKARLSEAWKEMALAEEATRQFLDVNRNAQASQDPAIRLKAARLEMELRLRQKLVVSIAENLEQALMEEKNDLPLLNILDAGNLPIEKSKPSRSVLVIFGFFACATGNLLWAHRAWVKKNLIDAGSVL